MSKISHRARMAVWQADTEVTRKEWRFNDHGDQLAKILKRYVAYRLKCQFSLVCPVNIAVNNTGKGFLPNRWWRNRNLVNWQMLYFVKSQVPSVDFNWNFCACCHIHQNRKSRKYLSGACLEIRNRLYRLYKADMLRESKWVVEGGWNPPLIAKFMGPIWGPRGADRTQVGPMLVTWSFLSGTGPRSWVAEFWWFGRDPLCWSHQLYADDMPHYIYMYFIYNIYI